MNWRIRLALGAVAVLVFAAILKPWSIATGPSGSRHGSTASSAAPATALVAGASLAPRSSADAQADIAAGLCQSPDGWRIVVDDDELGHPVRTWLAASAISAASGVQPVQATIPVASLVSAGVRRLGVCRPADLPGEAGRAWAGRLWWQSAGSSGSSRALIGQWAGPGGSVGAVAAHLGSRTSDWPPGLYLVEIRFAGSAVSTWLGLMIAAPG